MDDDELPGWTFIGEGSWRAVYRGPSGVAYKVPSPAAVDSYGEETAFASQYDEYENLTKYADRDWAPDVALFEIADASGDDIVPVVAMPFIDHDGSSLTEQGLAELAEINQLIDDGDWPPLIGANVKVVNGHPIVVDAGGSH
jgi:hypothetical protein